MGASRVTDGKIEGFANRRGNGSGENHSKHVRTQAGYLVFIRECRRLRHCLRGGKLRVA